LRLLLDTHILLWSVLASNRLPKRGVDMIKDPKNELFCSAAVIWKVAIKHAKASGRPDDIPMSGQALMDELEPLAIMMMPIQPSHAAAVGQLPPLHNDPFDRLMIAQARCEQMSFLTHDKVLSAYGDFVMLI
jgi:PIN domain nuclease of toxin-antitoxin system